MSKPARDRRVPLRNNIFVRLLATSVLVALGSGVATAWLAVTGTTRAIQQEQGQSFSDYTKVYDELLGYAATHTAWTDAEATVRNLAKQTGHRITLAAEDRRVMVSSENNPPALPPKPSAVVDPLAVDPVMADRAGTGGIDNRAVGPYRLNEEDRRTQGLYVRKMKSCAEYRGIAVREVPTPSGRIRVELIGNPDLTRKVESSCGGEFVGELTKTEAVALEQLTAVTNTCLQRQGIAPVKVNLGFTYTADQQRPVNSPSLKAQAPAAGPRPSEDASAPPLPDAAIQACLDASRKEQLRPFVAPPVLLFVTDGGGLRTVDPRFPLSRTNTLRMVGVTGVVLTLAVLVTVLIGLRLTRPLRALTLAASDPTGQMPRLPVRRNDEIGRLTAAFNALSERREATEQQRRSMVSDIAHELGTPLTNIRAWLQAASDGIADPDPELLALLSEEAVLLQHIIDDLRDLAAADAGNLRLHREQVFINDLIDQVVSAQLGRAETARVRLGTQLAGDPEVMADPNRLRQVIGNLLSNAIRHSRPGGEVTIRSRKDGSEVVIDVIDHGTGIEPANLPHVFERFWRADKSRNRQTGGSGLGLAIVRKLTEAHGGNVGVRSELGRGSTFTLRLPA